MDVKHRLAYAEVKIVGVADSIVINDGFSVAQLMTKIVMALHNAPNRYQGVSIDMQFEPINQHMTSQEKMLKEMIAMIPPGSIEMADDDAPDLWSTNPMNPNSPNYDALYDAYQQCSSPATRAMKTPEDLNILRRHMESHYAGTDWWDGSHRW